MTKNEAINLIRPAFANGTDSQLWADLGCGTGLFSKALSSLLPAQSRIICIDISHQPIVDSEIDKVKIQFVQADFTQFNFEADQYGGFLLANSLHSVADKYTLLKKLQKSLDAFGKLVVVEYDTKKRNQWVPYPVTYLELCDLVRTVGFASCRKIGERNALYSEKMYATEII